jgi:hypothetical protein
MSFKFAVGETVEYRPLGLKPALFQVIRHMPEEDGAAARKYRIKSAKEGYERSVFEFDLSPPEMPASSYQMGFAREY